MISRTADLPRKCVGVGRDGFIDGRVRHLIVVLAFALSVEPAHEVANCFSHDTFRIVGHFLPSRAVALDGDVYAYS